MGIDMFTGFWDDEEFEFVVNTLPSPAISYSVFFSRITKIPKELADKVRERYQLSNLDYDPDFGNGRLEITLPNPTTQDLLNIHDPKRREIIRPLDFYLRNVEWKILGGRGLTEEEYSDVFDNDKVTAEEAKAVHKNMITVELNTRVKEDRTYQIYQSLNLIMMAIKKILQY